MMIKNVLTLSVAFALFTVMATSAQAVVVLSEDYANTTSNMDLDPNHGWTNNGGGSQFSRPSPSGTLIGTDKPGGVGYAPHSNSNYSKALSSPINTLNNGDVVDVSETYGLIDGNTGGGHLNYTGILLDDGDGGTNPIGWQVDFQTVSTPTNDEHIELVAFGNTQNINSNVGANWEVQMTITGTGSGNADVEWFVSMDGGSFNQLGTTASGAYPGADRVVRIAHDYVSATGWFDDTTVEFTAIPEPSTCVLLLIGAAALCSRVRRRRV